MNKTKRGFFARINKSDKLLNRPLKEGRGGENPNQQIINEKEDIAGTIEIIRIIRD